jgi:hypothetical protein
MTRIARSKPMTPPTAPRSTPAKAQTAPRAPSIGQNQDVFEGKVRKFGIDTNAGDMPASAVKSHGANFVARYLSNDGTHPALTPAEAERWTKAGVPLVSVWETGRQEHVLAGNSLSAAYANGAADAAAALAAQNAAGGQGQPIYFTVDFNVNPKDWDTKVTDPSTGKTTTEGALIRSYFAGIRSVLPKDQVGVYGSETTVKHLLDHKTVGYAWQQAFGRKANHVDPRAQLLQTHIYPSQDGWGVNGAGALDFDSAVASDFGQWESTRVKPGT